MDRAFQCFSTIMITTRFDYNSRRITLWVSPFTIVLTPIDSVISLWQKVGPNIAEKVLSVHQQLLWPPHT